MTVIPGWTRDLAQRNTTSVTDTDIQAFFYDADEADFQADMAELDVLREKILTALRGVHPPIRPPEPGEVHRDAFLAVRTDMVCNLGLAADIGLCNPWPWDWARQQLTNWRRELDEARA